ncbi:hypothetical protein D3C87_1094220 [compost metagenome]
MFDSRIDLCRKQYALCVMNFLKAFTAESGKQIMADVVNVADKVAAGHNWYNASATVIRTGLWDEIRQDPKVHVTMIKFERMLLAVLGMEQMDEDFIKMINRMFLTTTLNDKIVDKDFLDTTKCLPAEQGFTVAAVPGLTGLLSVVLFRDLWTMVG